MVYNTLYTCEINGVQCTQNNSHSRLRIFLHNLHNLYLHHFVRDLVFITYLFYVCTAFLQADCQLLLMLLLLSLCKLPNIVLSNNFFFICVSHAHNLCLGFKSFDLKKSCFFFSNFLFRIFTQIFW